MKNEWPNEGGRTITKKPKVKIGILAIQGDFAKHCEIVKKLGSETLLVKTETELGQCDSLIIPGGESTTLQKLLIKHDLWGPLVAYSKTFPIFGTCAGCILLSKQSVNNSVKTLDIIDIKVSRNAYGRQVDSFIDDVEICIENGTFAFEGVFIRAPKIVEMGEGVKSIGFHKGNVVLAESENILVATFHPELTNDVRIHEYFISKTIQNHVERI
jgi:pyridoxal 5'-phosphate synthase pdxT subunit